MAVHMRKAYWPYRGVDSVCFCAEYGLVVLCLGLEAGELSTRALGASQDQRTHQQSLRMRPSYLRTHRHASPCQQVAEMKRGRPVTH